MEIRIQADVTADRDLWAVRLWLITPDGVELRTLELHRQRASAERAAAVVRRSAARRHPEPAGAS